MQSSTIDNTTFILTSGGSSVASTVSYSSNVATINPNVNLLFNTQYTVNILTGVKDAAGNALASAYTSSFTTKYVLISTNIIAAIQSVINSSLAQAIKLDWDAAPGISSYSINYGIVSSGTCSSYAFATTTATNSKTLYQLDNSTAYCFGIRSISPTGSQYSGFATITITTGS